VQNFPKAIINKWLSFQIFIKVCIEHRSQGPGSTDAFTDTKWIIGCRDVPWSCNRLFFDRLSCRFWRWECWWPVELTLEDTNPNPRKSYELRIHQKFFLIIILAYAEMW